MEGGSRRPQRISRLLTEPASPLLVLVDRDVLSRRQHEVEVPPPDWRIRPPAVHDPPFLAHLEDAHLPDRSRNSLLDRNPHGSRLVQSSRGTKIALASGIRDHGATSTTVQIASIPIATRTWRSPSRRRPRSRLPRGRTSSARVATDPGRPPSPRRPLAPRARTA